MPLLGRMQERAASAGLADAAPTAERRCYVVKAPRHANNGNAEMRADCYTL